MDWPKRFPTNSTYSEALARCDAQQIVTVVASASIPQGIFPSNKPRGIESTRRRSPMCLLLYGVICGMISVIRRHPKTLMSFYSHAQIWLVSLTWCVPRLKMCKVQETSYQITEAELARFPGFVGCRASHKASGSMHRNEPLQAVYKGLSSHFIKSSCVVIWYMILFRQKNTDRPTGKLSFINTVPFCRRYRSITIHLTCLSYHSPIEARPSSQLLLN